MIPEMGHGGAAQLLWRPDQIAALVLIIIAMGAVALERAGHRVGADASGRPRRLSGQVSGATDRDVHRRAASGAASYHRLSIRVGAAKRYFMGTLLHQPIPDADLALRLPPQPLLHQLAAGGQAGLFACHLPAELLFGHTELVRYFPMSSPQDMPGIS